MKTKELIKRYILLVVGTFFIGLGVAISKRSDLGISPVSSLANVVSERFDFLTVGTWLMVWNVLLILAEVCILKGKFKPLQLLQLPISILMGVFTDAGVWMASFIPVNSYPVQILCTLLGVTVLGFGISLTVISDTVMNVAEAFVDVVAKKLNKNFGNVKVFFDVSCVLLAVIASLILFHGRIIGVREGTVITACCAGFVVKFFTRTLRTHLEGMLK